MERFYATAKNNKGKSFIIYNNESFKDRLTAKLEAERQCKLQDLILDGVYVSEATNKQGGVLTKFKKYRSKNQGRNSKSYKDFL